jgi:phosphoglycerol transferase MdoB-like AlkP superfamily enzyme
MASNTVSNNSGGIGVLGLLGVSFVVLKLCNVINWSWWWVTAPFWGWIPLVAVIAVAIVLIAWLRAWFE